MKKTNKLLVALCLALIACLAAPALLPAGLNAATSAQAAEKLKLNKKKATLYSGKTVKLKVTGTDKTVKWSSSNPKVAKVNQKGLVTAKKVGKTRITARVGSKKLTCAITVVSCLSASATRLTLDVGETYDVTLTYKLNGGLSLRTYDSSMMKCTLGRISRGQCTLSIKAKRPGTQTIVVKNTKNSDTVKIVVTVREEVDPSTSIVDRTAVTLAVGTTATVRVSWPYAGVPHMWWDDSSVVTCTWGEWDDSGWPLYIKGEGAGSAKIWFTKGDDPSEAPLATINVTVK